MSFWCWVIAGLFAAILNVADEWKAPFRAETEIDLSFWKLPQYTLFSLARGCVALGLSLVFAILYGTWAYYDRKARGRFSCRRSTSSRAYQFLDSCLGWFLRS